MAKFQGRNGNSEWVTTWSQYFPWISAYKKIELPSRKSTAGFIPNAESQRIDITIQLRVPILDASFISTIIQLTTLNITTVPAMEIVLQFQNFFLKYYTDKLFPGDFMAKKQRSLVLKLNYWVEIFNFEFSGRW